MFRLIASACLIVGLSGPLRAEEICIACDGPEAAYRCVPELPAAAAGSEVSTTIGAKACTTVLSKAGGHEACHAITSSEPCKGRSVAVTLTDYQRAIAGNGQPSTYQPGAFEIARQNVHDTWLCLTSLFGDC